MVAKRGRRFDTRPLLSVEFPAVTPLPNGNRRAGMYVATDGGSRGPNTVDRLEYVPGLGLVAATMGHFHAEYPVGAGMRLVFAEPVLPPPEPEEPEAA